MKTKIMLASAVVLAVALVGTARPAVGIEKNKARATVVESALPAPAVYDVAAPALAAQEKQAEKVIVQEKEKEKAKKEKKLVVTTKDAAKTPIVITITEGDKVQTLTLDKPLTITSEKDGHVLVLTSEGKDLKVLKGEPLRLEIKGGAIGLIKEGKAVEVGEGGVYTIVKEGDKEGSRIVFYGTAKGETAGEGQVVKVIKEGEKWIAAEPVKEATVLKEGEAVKVVVGKTKYVSPTIVWTVKEPGKEGALWVTKEADVNPHVYSFVRDKELLDKVRKIREQVEAVKAKKMDIDVLQKSLEKLEFELQAKEEKLQHLEGKLDKMSGEVAVIKKIRGDEAKGDLAVWVAEGDEDDEADEAKAVAMIGVSTGDNAIQIILTGIEAGEGGSAYPRGVAFVDRLKKDLPEGYKILESKYDKEAGTMTFKIAPPEGKKIDQTLVRKLVDGLKAELKTKK